ncbi:MAG: hypothetical protein LBH71_01825, partial [Oscillospiraceae bacterium]|nr:hypothetical protein [Oscillospiraceae bacterium]
MLKNGKILRSIVFCVLCVTLLGTTMLSALAAKDGTYTYDNNGYITSLDKTLSGAVTIPSTAQGIRSGAFKNKTIVFGIVTTVKVTDITSVVIPSSVTVIESG